MATIVIYHDNCIDGFTSAWIASRYVAPSAKFLPMSYGAGGTHELPEGIDDADVLVLDFSFSADNFRQLYNRAKSLVVLDHHKGVAQKVREAMLVPPTDDEDPENTFYSDGHAYIVVDTKLSGSALTLRFFDEHPHHSAIASTTQLFGATKANFFDRRQRQLDLINAYDLGHWDDPAVVPYNTWLNSITRGFDSWSWATAQDISGAVHEGHAIIRYQERLAREILAKGQVKGGMFQVVCMSALVNIVSDVFHRDRPPLILQTFAPRLNGSVKVSLRGRDDLPDCSAIAKFYGGGGNANAAGWVVEDAQRERVAEHERRVADMIAKAAPTKTLPIYTGST